MSAAQSGLELESLREKLLGFAGFAFFDQNACHIDPTIGVFRIDLRHLLKRANGACEVALPEQTNTVVVPASGIAFVRRWIGEPFSAGREIHRRRRNGYDRKIR